MWRCSPGDGNRFPASFLPASRLDEIVTVPFRTHFRLTHPSNLPIPPATRFLMPDSRALPLTLVPSGVNWSTTPGRILANPLAVSDTPKPTFWPRLPKS